MQTSAPLITRFDYQAMREGPPYYQLIEGDLVMSSSPNTYHQQIIIRIVTAIQIFLESHPLGEVFVAPLDVFLTETNVYQPDVIFLTTEHLSLVSEHGIEGAPDLVIEILSPSTATLDKGLKRKIFAKTGVQELWLVDPDAKRIQIYRLQDSADMPAATHGPNSLFSSALLPGLKFRASSIFKRRAAK